MSELPGRPDIDQLRRQARELLRAARGGDPHALSRLRAVSERVTLSTAQLALAREHGFPSWPALRAEVERRSSERWSFGWAAPIETAAGALSPGELVIGPGHAALDASLVFSEELVSRAPWPDQLGGQVPLEARAAMAEFMAGGLLSFDDVLVTDDRASRYTIFVEEISGWPALRGQAREPVSLRLRLDPVPPRDCRWLELSNRAGSATRLLPSARPAMRISPLAQLRDSAAERELEELALWLIDRRNTGTGGAGEDEGIRRSCSSALDRAAQLRRSGELDQASGLPEQLARLCAVLTRRHPAGDLPSAWSRMLDAAHRADGPRYHLDIGAVLPPVDDTTMQVDCVVSEPGSWRVHLQARPGWWIYSPDGRSKRYALVVGAEDNLGGRYVTHFGGGTSDGDHTEFALGFRPRLDPLASAVKLSFTGARERVVAEIALAPASGPQGRQSR
jgi:hypothetical protein